MEDGEHANGEHATEKDIMVISGCRRNELDVLSAISVEGLELSKNGDEELREWESHEVFDKVILV